MTVEIVRNFFKKLADANIFVAAIPGNHDYLVKGGVYESGDLAQGNLKIVVFNKPEQNVAKINELDLSIYAKPNTTPTGKQSPLFQMRKEDKGSPLQPAKEPVQSQSQLRAQSQSQSAVRTKYNIAIAHGSAEVKGQRADNYPVTSAEISASGFNYVALGDWHKMLDVSAGNVKAFYPGSPEPLATDQTGAGNVLLIEIEEKTTKVQPLKIGKISIVNASIDMTGQKENLITKIEQVLDTDIKSGKSQKSDVILNIMINGRQHLGGDINSDELKSYFSQKVFLVNVQDSTVLEFSNEDLAKFPDYTIAGKFINHLRNKKGVDERARKEAIQRGLDLLTSLGQHK
ncbi:MAG: Metallophosphoesterase [candidate division WS6 bacterium GW2011_GWA2_37_6]|uniref:Metallophosphoesterase n=1 Tax=candidate division WS6 bacterium GW2011_GWA2_37_6 TaxID=1619087 RepID=A0A0G0H8B7_9BACT|nr:MAG: Metallophosphoesterase [candidate division WS6 bacterium GW2011_GWA2_37_6]